MAGKKKRKKNTPNPGRNAKSAKSAKSTPSEQPPPVVVSLVESDDDDDDDPDATPTASDSPSPEAPSPEEQVLQLLLGQGLPLSRERALLLIETTRTEHAGDDVDVDAWADACMVAMAIDNEIDDEAADVGIAMRDSLEAAEAARPSKKWWEEPPAAILDHYCTLNSQIAAYLRDDGDESVPARVGLVELCALLDLEVRCAKWYGDASRKYFKELIDDGTGETNTKEDVACRLLASLSELQREILTAGREDFFVRFADADDVIALE